MGGNKGRKGAVPVRRETAEASPVAGVRSPELQARIDAYYAEWYKSRAKWKTPRGKWHAIIEKLHRADAYRYVPESPMSEKELISLRAILHTSVPTRMFHWSVRRDGDAIVIQRIGLW